MLMNESRENKPWRFTPLAIPAKYKEMELQYSDWPVDLLGYVSMPSEPEGIVTTESLQREARFEQILQEPIIELGNYFPHRILLHEALRSTQKTILEGYSIQVKSCGLAYFSGTIVLQGYLPNITSRHSFTLERRRKEYQEIVSQHFGSTSRRDESIMHQIAIDVPRTAPDSVLFKNPFIRESLARILYCWSIRRPASGYVQGINDLVTPFYQVFIDELAPTAALESGVDKASVDSASGDAPNIMTIRVSEDSLRNAEADVFWCFSLLLDTIQDNYTFSQSGISRQLQRMREIVQRTDTRLLRHLDSEGITLIQFAFRWINCLLIREFPLHMIVRMWDTYLAEGDGGFSSFHIFVCAAFLCKWSDHLQLLEFQDILLFLQNPPTASWTLEDLEMLLSEAFMWKTVFEGSLDHLQASK